MPKLTYLFYLILISALACMCAPARGAGAPPVTYSPQTTIFVQQAQTQVDALKFGPAMAILLKAYNTPHPDSDELPIEKTILYVLELWGAYLEQSDNYAAALYKYQEAADMARLIGAGPTEEENLCSAGLMYEDLGEYGQALEMDHQALALATKLNDSDAVATDLGNIGIVYESQGQYDQALTTTLQSLAMAAKLHDSTTESHQLNNLGIIYEDLGQYAKALDYEQQCLPIARKLGDIDLQEDAVSNTGIVYEDLGEHARALSCDGQALKLAVIKGSTSAREKDLSNIGAVYIASGEYRRALQFALLALTMATNLGEVSRQEQDLGNIGAIYLDLDQYDQAMAYDRRSLALATSIGDVETAEHQINNIGDIYLFLGQYDKAQMQYEAALAMRAQVNDLAGQAITLNNLMFLEKDRNSPDLAIYYGKRAVNIYQTVRSNVAKLDASAQKSYLGTVETTYRGLADLLITSGRLPEAEQVLAMLKDQEASDFVARDAQLTPVSLSISFDPSEQAADTQTQGFADPVISIGHQLDTLRSLKQRTPDQAAQIVALSTQLDNAKAKYDQYVATDLPKELASAPDTNQVNPTDLSPIQQQLRAMGPGTVAVITLVESDYLRLIVVTSQTQKAEVAHISAVDLRREISQWRQALQNPNLDPRPLGQQLAKAIIGPIQADLNGAGATTILFSLDDVLRYVPMAALYDGGHYLVEKYRVAVFTGATLTNPSPPVDWSASPQTLLALGVTQPHKLPDLDTGQPLTFPALPGVAQEIDDIARTSTSPGGVLSGETLEDAQFTAKSLQLGLATGYPVVHIASHFELGSKDTTSFLLLGDGTALTLDKLFHKGGQVFQGVDLLTLSACQTGEDVAASDGHAFESLGMVAEEQGASSILASLWPVSDESTPLLMHAFYDKKANTPNMTKAEALREAQTSMISGTINNSSATPSKTRAGRSAAALTTRSSEDLPAFVRDGKAPYAHPYYWAPFVLIGEWK